MSLLLPFTTLIVSWSLDTTDPVTQRYIIITFLSVHAALFLGMCYVFYLIWRRGDADLVETKDSYTDEKVVKAAWDYDAGKLRELLFTKIGLSAAVSYFAATRYLVVFPLLLQCANNPRTFYNSELFQIYVLGKKTEGKLARPFEEPSMVPNWAKGIWEQSEKDATEFMGSPTANGKQSRRKKK